MMHVLLTLYSAHYFMFILKHIYIKSTSFCHYISAHLIPILYVRLRNNTYIIIIFCMLSFNTIMIFFQRLEWHSTDADYKMCLVKGKDEVRFLIYKIVKLWSV